MKEIYFSAKTLGFYPESMKPDYENGIGWPDDAVEISMEQWQEFTGPFPAGKYLGSDESGYPVWVSIPEPTHEEMVEAANAEKQRLIDAANSYMNGKQWPGKAAIGRLEGDDLAKYNSWLDYLDALEAVAVTNPDEIDWPENPTM